MQSEIAIRRGTIEKLGCIRYTPWRHVHCLLFLSWLCRMAVRVWQIGRHLFSGAGPRVRGKLMATTSTA